MSPDFERASRYGDALRRQIVYKAKKNAGHYSDPLDLTASLATPLASVWHRYSTKFVSRKYMSDT